MKNRFLPVFLAVIGLLTLSCSSSPNHSQPLLPLSALKTKSPSGLTGTLAAYDSNGVQLTLVDLIFNAGKIYTPSISLPKNAVYDLIAVFYYDDTLPIGFLRESITVGAEDSYSFSLHKENLYFNTKDITNEDLLASVNDDIDAGLLPDLDLDDDGFSNDEERRGESDAYDATNVPSGPTFTNVDVDYADDGNLVTITVDLKDGNRIESVSTSVAQYSYLARGGIFTENLSGDELDTERTYTLSFNPQYAPVGDLVLNFSATNSIDLVSTDSTTLTIENNDENVGPVITFDSLNENDTLGGEVEIGLSAYDRDGVLDLKLNSPSTLSDTAGDAAYFLGEWDTSTQVDGGFTIKATATDALGKTTVRTLPITIENGSDGSGPSLQMTVNPPNSSSVEIDYLNGEAVYGLVTVRVNASDAGTVDNLELYNTIELDCGPNSSDCPFLYDDFQTSSPTYINYFDSTQYDDGDFIDLVFYANDEHGNQQKRTFTIKVQNTPEIVSVTPNSTTIANQDSVILSWVVESRTTTVEIFDADGDSVECSSQTQTQGEGSCEFTPTSSQAYSLKATYTTTNKDGEEKSFATTLDTPIVFVDSDGDGTNDEDDSGCYKNTVAEQDTDSDGDGYADICDPDKDGDGYYDAGFAFEAFYDLYVGGDTVINEDTSTTIQNFADLYTTTNYSGEDCEDDNREKSPNANEKLNGIDDNCSQTFNPTESLPDILNVDEFDFFTDDTENTLWRFEGESGKTGSVNGDHIGREVVQIGDLDGDGIGELAIVSAHKNVNSVNNQGVIYILLSQNYKSKTKDWVLNNVDDTAINITDVADYRVELDATSLDGNGGFASHVRTLDFDGNGQLDLLIAEPFADRPDTTPANSTYPNRKAYDAGRVTIIFDIQYELQNQTTDGALSLRKYLPFESGNRTESSLIFYGGYEASASGTGYDYLGWSVDVADYNGDGSDDILLGAPGSSSVIGTSTNSQYYRSLDRGYAFLITGLNEAYQHSLDCFGDCEFQLNPFKYGRVNHIAKPSMTYTSGTYSLGQTEGHCIEDNIRSPQSESSQATYGCDYEFSTIFAFTGGAPGDTLGNQVVFVNDMEIDTDNNMEVLLSAPGYDGRDDIGGVGLDADDGTNSGALGLFLSSHWSISDDNLGNSSYAYIDDIMSLDDDVNEDPAALVINGQNAGDQLGGNYYNSDPQKRIGHIFAKDTNGNIYIGAPNAKNSSSAAEPKVYSISMTTLEELISAGTTSTSFSENINHGTWSQNTDNGFGNAIAVCDDFDETTSSYDHFLMTGGFLEDWVEVYPIAAVNDENPSSIAELFRDVDDSQFGSSLQCIDLDGDGFNTDLFIGAWDDPANVNEDNTKGHVYLIQNSYK